MVMDMELSGAALSGPFSYTLSKTFFGLQDASGGIFKRGGRRGKWKKISLEGRGPRYQSFQEIEDVGTAKP
jgi:hypothetical protein